MKKLYLFCGMLLASMLSFMANAFTITFNVDHPENVSLEISYEEKQLHQGDNTFDFMGSYTSIKISGKNGCKVTAKDPDGNNIEVGYSFFSNEQKYGGKTITITSQKPEEYRTGSVKVNIDKASAVKISVNKSSNDVSYYPELTDGDNTIYYEPGVDKMLRIYSSVSAQVPLYSVTVENGTTEAVQTNFVYDVALPCDGDVVVKGVFPDKECTVTLNYGEGIEGFVTKITKDTASGESVDFSNGSFKVNAGTVLYIHGNTNEYLLESYTVDDATVNFSTPQRLVVIDKDINVSFAGRKYNKFDVNITVDNPSFVVAKVGTKMNPGAVIALNEGKNVVSFSENDPNIFFTVSNDHDYKITAITYNGGNIMADYSGAFKIEGLKADDKIEIATAEIVRDLEAVVYIDEADGSFKLSDSFGNEIKLATGYNHINFCKEDTPFKLSPTGFYNTSAYVYSNDETVKDNGGFGTMRAYMINASNGSVIKIYAVASEEPEWYTLNFEEKGFGDVDVTADEIRQVADRAGFETLEGTKIAITPKDGKNIKSVTVDNADVPETDGKYIFAVSGNHNIAINSTSGINEIVVGTAAENSAIYNIQGIRINKTAEELPAGLYIINGKKVLVK